MKMKSLLFIIRSLSLSVALLTAQLVAHSQGLTQAEKQSTIDSLGSNDTGTRFWAIDRILQYRISDALPSVRTLIWTDPSLGVRSACLRVIAALDSANIQEFAHRVIDSAGIFVRSTVTPHPYDSLDFRAMAGVFLLRTGDYSGLSYIFAILQRDTINPNTMALVALKDVIMDVPSYADSARVLLRKFAREAIFSLHRAAALIALEATTDPEAENIKLWAIENDPDPAHRFTMLLQLRRARARNIRDVLYQRLRNESVPIYRILVGEMLLCEYGDSLDQSGLGTPEDYKEVADALNAQPDSTRRFMAKDLEYFRPQPPPHSMSIVVCLDSLLTVAHQVAAFNWLGDQNFATELDSLISQARTYAVEGDSNNCARSIKAFQNSVDTAYHDSVHTNNRVVTIEGWKFLYYKSQYILDRLP